MTSIPVEKYSTDISPPKSLLPWLVCLTAALFFFYEFIQMNMIDAISQDLMRAFSIDATNLNKLSSTYFWGDVALLFPAGLLLDRISVKKIIIFGMLMGILGSVIFAYAHSFALASAAHFLAGVGNAFSFMSCIKLASRWFPPKRLALVIGLIVTFAMAGGIVAQTPFTILNQMVGWRHVLQINALLGTSILLLVMLVVRDYPPGSAALRAKEHEALSQIGFAKSITLALKNTQNWLCGLYTSLLNFPLMVFGAADGVLHLTQDHHLSADKASVVVTMLFLGTIIGSPTISWLSDFIERRKLPMIICAILAFLTMLAIMFIPNLSYTDLITLYLLLGIITSSQVIGYPTVSENNPKYLTGTAMGLASVLIMGGGGLSEVIFGKLLDKGGSTTLINNVVQYSHHDFLRALTMMPVAFFLGLIAALLIRETFCRNVVETQS